MNRKRVVRGVIANGFDKFVIALMQLALVPTLALHWGLPLYGSWVMLSTVPSFLAVSDFGFSVAAGTRMTMLVSQSREDDAEITFQSSWYLVVLSSICMFMIAAAIAMFAPQQMMPTTAGLNVYEARITLVVLMLYGIIALQGSILMAGWKSSGLYSFGTTATAFMILSESLAAVFAVILGAGPLVTAICILSVRSLALTLQAVLLTRKVVWLHLGFHKVDMRVVRELIAPAMAVMMLPLSQALVLQGTAMMLGIAYSKAAVPAFVATRTLSRVGLQFTQLLNHALMPEFSAATGRGDRNARATMMLATLLAALVVLIPASLILAIWGREVVALWTRGAIIPERSLMVAMAATVILGGFWNPVSNLILAMNRHSAYSYPYAVCSILTLPLTFVLARQFGATGAAVALALMDFVMLIVVLRAGKGTLPPIGDLVGAVKRLNLA